MTHNRQSGTETRYIESREEGRKMVAKRSEDNQQESLESRIPANWAWANSRSGYDWMDSHFPFTDLC